jgi:hypothetical protein
MVFFPSILIHIPSIQQNSDLSVLTQPDEVWEGGVVERVRENVKREEEKEEGEEKEERKFFGLLQL